MGLNTLINVRSLPWYVPVFVILRLKDWKDLYMSSYSYISQST